MQDMHLESLTLIWCLFTNNMHIAKGREIPFKDTQVRELPCRDVILTKRAKKQTIKIRDKKGFPGGAPGIYIYTHE